MAEQRSYTGSFNNRWKFTGKEMDEETGLYYYGARFYNPSTSIWLSVDPLAEVYPTISPYAYVANNPIAFVDPDGKRIKPWKTTYSFFGIKWTIYHGLTDINNADKKFDKSYSSLMKSSNVFRTAIARLKKSNRDHEFRTIYKKSGSTENRGKYGSFNPDDNSINFVVDLSSSDAYTGRKSTVFEEVFHAA